MKDISFPFSDDENSNSNSLNTAINNSNLNLIFPENNKSIVNYNCNYTSIIEDNLNINKIHEHTSKNNPFFEFFHPNDLPILVVEDNSTLIKTNNKACNHHNHQIPIFSLRKEEEKEKILPDFYSMDLIIEKVGENINEPEIKSILLELSEKNYIQELGDYKFMQFGKRKRNRQKDNNINKSEQISINKKNNRGRKSKKNGQINVHNRMSDDNIIRKIKSKLLNYILLNFLNNLLLILGESNKLLKLDYKYIKNIKKNFDLKLLKMPLKELYSLNISGKYKKEKNHNKKIIGKIIEKINGKKEKSLEDNAVIFIFNINYENFIDIFIHKRNIEDLIEFYNKGKNDINCNIIKNNLFYVKDLFIDLLNKYDKKYTSLYLLYLYNMERYFLLKKKRTNKEKNQ